MIYTPLLEKVFPWILFRINSQNQANLYLTFDDGPDSDSTLEICEILEKSNIKASFFAVGNQVKKFPNVVGQLDRFGHLICNHSYQHCKFYSKNWILEEINKTNNLIQSITEKSINFYRPPHGRIFPGLKQVMENLNMKVVLWDVFVPDYKTSFNSDRITYRIMTRVRNGSIILLHDRSENVTETIKALPGIIKILKDRGFTFKTLPFIN